MDSTDTLFPITTVVNIHHSDYDVYIGRPSKWGNPYRLGSSMSKAQAIALYEKYAREHFTETDLAEIRGKRLGCFCAPASCHGDVLVRLADSG